MIAVVGRGHSGTSAIARTLQESGVFIGHKLNVTYDMMPARSMYKACWIAGLRTRWRGDLSWDWTELHKGEIPPGFVGLIRSYLKPVLEHPEPKGWKIPETVLALPWVVRLFPNVHYIYVIRDPRDTILRRHKMTDDLGNMGIRYPRTRNGMRMRAISWWYQYQIVQDTPKPERWIEIRFEDFILKQEETLARLETFLDMSLARIPVREDPVGRHRQSDAKVDFDFLEPALAAYGYAS